MKMSNYPVWNKENTYKKYDVVQYIGSLYAALSAVPSGVEIDDKSKWLMIYKNGALTNHERYQGLLIEQASETGGGGGGGSYTAGDGIDITNDEISVNNTIARQSSVNTLQTQVTTQYNTIEQMRTDLGGFSHDLSQLTLDVGAIAGRIFIAEYGVTTAEEIIAFLDYTNEPFAPMFVKRAGSFYTVVTAAKQADDRVIIRTLGTLSGAYYIFVYDITGSVWATNNYGFQQALVSGTNIKTINGQSVLGAGDIPVSGGTVDQTFDATSANAQSGTAVDEALKNFFSIKGANNDNITVASGARVNTTIQVVPVDESAQIASYKRVFISNATDGGTGRDKIALQSMSTGGGGKQANIAVINTGSTDAKIKVEVECLCLNYTL